MGIETGLRVKKGSSRSTDAAVAARELFDAIYDPAAALTIVYCSPAYDLAVLGAELRRLFGETPVIGCTTAGEISPLGYLEGSLTGVSLGGPGLRAASVRLDDLKRFELAQGEALAKAAMTRLGERPEGEDDAQKVHRFAFLLVDGLSMQEEGLTATIHRALGHIPLVGGSAGDGTRFEKTFLYHDGEFRSDRAILTLVESVFPFVAFKTESFVASAAKMVVTRADPANRIVHEIDGEAAVEAYARVVGVTIDELTPLFFASRPVAISVRGEIHLRAIQKITDGGGLKFFCAIDEGSVLSVGESVDMVSNLARAFERVKDAIGPPSIVLGCDCISRFDAMKEQGIRARMTDLMVANNVVGFSTYGEQYNAIHVNQTFAGVAIAGARAHV